jgi:glycerophosphoryl diester phosphodiesterase
MSPMISAHRGSFGGAGVPAAERYDRAIALGVDYVELDLRRTSDGVYVNYHDGVTPSGRSIAALAYAELKSELGSEILRLDELFDVVAGRASLHVDLKETGYETDILQALLGRAAVDRFVVTTGDVESIRTIKEQFPAVRAGLTLGTDMKGAQAWVTARERLGDLFPTPRLRRSHADFVAAHEQLARIRLLGYCARRSMACWVWTVDEETEIARFMADERVTTLITNRPDIAIKPRSA